MINAYIHSLLHRKMCKVDTSFKARILHAFSLEIGARIATRIEKYFHLHKIKKYGHTMIVVYKKTL
jgi:hypothetical protein